MPLRIRTAICVLALAVFPVFRSAEAQTASPPTGPKALALLLKSPDAAVRADAASRLAALGPKGADAIPELTDALLDLDPRARREILHALQAMGPRAGDATPSVAILLRHEDRDTRLQAVQALLDIGRADASVGPLADALLDDDPGVRTAAADALGKFGKASDAAIPRLMRVARRDSSESVRAAAKAALPRIAPGGGLAAHVAVRLRSTDPEIRVATTTTIGEMGEDARPIVPQILRATRDPDARVRFAAARAAIEIAPDSASVQKAVLRILRDPLEDRIERTALASAASTAGIPLTAAVPDWIAQAKSPDLLVRKGAIVILGIVKPSSQEIVQTLIVALGDSVSDVRGLAAESLGGIGGFAKDALPALDHLRTSDRDGGVRVFASAAYDRIDSE